MFHCVYVPQLLYPFICQWTSRLLPCSSYCKYCCNEQWDICHFQILVSSGYMLRSGIAGSYGGFIPSFLSNLHTIFHVGMYQLTFPPTVQECSLFSTPFPAFIVCRLFEEGHSDWCEVISHFSFDLSCSYFYIKTITIDSFVVNNLVNLIVCRLHINNCI